MRGQASKESGQNTRPFETRAFFWFALGATALGVVARLSAYAHRRALWTDEAALAVNVVQRSFSGLLEPLDLVQNSPIAFLLSTKAVTSLLGTSEYAFRLLPLLFGLAGLAAFLLLVRRVGKLGSTGAVQAAVVFAVAATLMAGGQYAVYYANEFRHYTGDIFFAALLTLLAVPRDTPENAHPWPVKRLVALAAVGAVAVWFSLASIFILAGIGLTLAVATLRQRDYAGLMVLAVGGAAWLACFYVHMRFHQANVAANAIEGELDRFWARAFMPFPPSGIGDLRWIQASFEKMLDFPGGIRYPGIALFAMAAGAFALWRKSKTVLALAVLPFVFALGASAAHKYPFEHRYLMFLTPFVYLLAGEGVGLVYAACAKLRVRPVAAVLALLLVLWPLANAARVTLRGDTRQEFRPILAHIEEHWQPGDHIYVTPNAVPPFLFYREQYGLPEDAYELEPREYRLESRAAAIGYREGRIAELARENGRVWALFDGDTTRPIAHPGQSDRLGEQLDIAAAPGASVFLYRRAAPRGRAAPRSPAARTWPTDPAY